MVPGSETPRSVLTIPSAGPPTPEEIADLTKTVVPLRITGPLSSPSVMPDVEALLRSKVEEKVKEEIEDKLKDLFKR